MFMLKPLALAVLVTLTGHAMAANHSATQTQEGNNNDVTPIRSFSISRTAPTVHQFRFHRQAIKTLLP